jgi:Flp pilus assembly protein TadD
VALETCRSVARREPSNPTNHYNLAGVYALLDRPDEALASLQEDFALGDRDHQYLAADAWFVSLHGDPRFEALLETMKTTPGRP